MPWDSSGRDRLSGLHLVANSRIKHPHRQADAHLHLIDAEAPMVRLNRMGSLPVLAIPAAAGNCTQPAAINRSQSRTWSHEKQMVKATSHLKNLDPRWDTPDLHDWGAGRLGMPLGWGRPLPLSRRNFIAHDVLHSPSTPPLPPLSGAIERTATGSLSSLGMGKRSASVPVWRRPLIADGAECRFPPTQSSELPRPTRSGHTYGLWSQFV